MIIKEEELREILRSLASDIFSGKELVSFTELKIDSQILGLKIFAAFGKDLILLKELEKFDDLTTYIE